MLKTAQNCTEMVAETESIISINCMPCVCISDDWLMFDDDNVAPVKADDILKLSGGGETLCLLHFPAPDAWRCGC